MAREPMEFYHLIPRSSPVVLAARDPLFAQIVAQGGADDLETALAELEHLA